MFMLARGYYDIDDVTLYGPFDSYREAEKLIPTSSDDGYEYRVMPVNPIANFAADLAEESDDDDAAAAAEAQRQPVPSKADEDARLQSDFQALVTEYGSAEAIPAPNPIVFDVAELRTRPVHLYFPDGQAKDWEELRERLQPKTKPRRGLFQRMAPDDFFATAFGSLVDIDGLRATWEQWGPLYEAHKPRG